MRGFFFALNLNVPINVPILMGTLKEMGTL